MMNFPEILTKKIKSFTKKYYVNELIKGFILYITVGSLYFFLIATLEHFFWFNKIGRSFLFWLFILVEIILVFYYLVRPILKLLGINKGLTNYEVAKIIGTHFSNVKDTLLNTIQLSENNDNNELVLASIKKKSAQLSPLPFNRAINFKSNKKYLRFVLIPVLILVIAYTLNIASGLSFSFNRIVNHTQYFEKPALFSYHVKNNHLKVVEGEPFTLVVDINGSIIPENVFITFNNEEYLLTKTTDKQFEYKFTSVLETLNFKLYALDVDSRPYTLNVVKRPIISNFKVSVKYPHYTGLVNKTLNNIGSFSVPKGTQLNWSVATIETDTLYFNEANTSSLFEVNNKQSDVDFSFKKRAFQNFDYKIIASNQNLSKYEQLPFSVKVIEDDFPSLTTTKENEEELIIYGRAADDYGLTKIQLVYFNVTSEDDKKVIELESLKNQSLYDFEVLFPGSIDIKSGENYTFYIEVFDNDVFEGGKSVKSDHFNYYQKTEAEIEKEHLENQANTIDIFNDLLKKDTKEEDSKDLINSLKQKKNINWEDSKKISDFIERQKSYEKMLAKQTNEINKSLDKFKADQFEEKKENLMKRINDLTKKEDESLLKELDDLKKKIDKEGLLKKLEDLKKKNKRKKNSLERALELLKRFYVEQKISKISKNLKKLAKEQDSIKKLDNSNALKNQKGLSQNFDSIVKDIKNTLKDNKALERPMEMVNPEREVESINSEFEKSFKNSEQQNSDPLKRNQSTISRELKKMSKLFEESSSSNSKVRLDENIDDLRSILENTLTFSNKQEHIIDQFRVNDNNHPNYPILIKNQQVLKEYFGHIDDSIFTLSLRLEEMGTEVQEDIEKVYDNIENGLTNFSDNKVSKGRANLRHSLTSVNDIAVLLSNLLESLQNASMSLSKGESSGDDFQLPDIIKKQKELSDKLKKQLDGKEGEEGKEGKESSKPGEEGKEGKESSQSEGEGGGEEGKESSQSEGEGGEEGNENSKSGENGEHKGGKGDSGKTSENGGEGKKQGNSKENSENAEKNRNAGLSNEELYEIFKEQSMIREAFKEMQNAMEQNTKGQRGSQGTKGKLNKMGSKMKDLEEQLLKKGITKSLIDKMIKLEHELLEFDEAEKSKGYKQERESKSNTQILNRKMIKGNSTYYKKHLPIDESILRQPLPMRNFYKVKTNTFFKNQFND